MEENSDSSAPNSPEVTRLSGARYQQQESDGNSMTIDDDKIREAFDRAVEKRMELESKGRSADYLSGVAAALGWALGEYEDDPTE